MTSVDDAASSDSSLQTNGGRMGMLNGARGYARSHAGARSVDISSRELFLFSFMTRSRCGVPPEQYEVESARTCATLAEFSPVPLVI